VKIEAYIEAPPLSIIIQKKSSLKKKNNSFMLKKDIWLLGIFLEEFFFRLIFLTYISSRIIFLYI